jgi:hypothetical protein
MGLTTWKGDAVRRSDVTVAKNYLDEDEIRELNRIVTMWLDFAEDQARRRKQVFLRDWETKLNEFLRFNERAVLEGKGTVSKVDADARAEAESMRFVFTTEPKVASLSWRRSWTPRTSLTPSSAVWRFRFIIPILGRPSTSTSRF